jgi:hypothetical protein
MYFRRVLCRVRRWSARHEQESHLPASSSYRICRAQHFHDAVSNRDQAIGVAYDLREFFAVMGKAPAQVTAADVLGFVTAQHTGAVGRLRLAGAEVAGVSARTAGRRLSSVSGLFGFLQARGDVDANPVPRLPWRPLWGWMPALPGGSGDRSGSVDHPARGRCGVGVAE